MGVGTSKGAHGVRWGVARRILVAWVLTIPASMAIGAGSWLVLDHARPRQPDRTAVPGGSPVVRLIPKDEAFELFITDGENLLEAARGPPRDGHRVTTGSTSASARSRRSSTRATRSTSRSPPASSTRSSPRSTARTSTSSSRASTTSSTASRRSPRPFVIYGIDGADRRGAAARRDPRGPGGAAPGGAPQARSASRRSGCTSRRSTTSRTRRTACPGRRSARLFRDGTRRHRGHQVARPLQRPREHDRRRRGRGRGDRADAAKHQ